MNYTDEITGNKNMMNFLIDRVLKENNERHKQTHNNLVNEINELNGRLLAKDDEIKSLTRKYRDSLDENKVILEANKELTDKVQRMREELKSLDDEEEVKK